MRSLCLLIALLAATPVSSQLAPCFALNDQDPTVFSAITGVTSGFATTTQAWQVIPTANVTVRSMRILTEHRFLAQRLAGGGWTHQELEIRANSPLGEPGVRLGGGVWQVSGTRGLAWQGANFDVPVTLTAGQPYWIVWTDPGWSQVSEGPSGVQLPTLKLGQATRVWSPIGPPSTSALKFRMYCGLLDDPGVSVHGATCLASSGATATLFSNESPMVGNSSFSVEGGGFPAGAGAILILGVDPTWVSLPFPFFPAGCALHTDIVLTFNGVTGSSWEAGHVRFRLPLPANPALMGGFLSTQVGVVDAGSPASIPVVMSNALRLTLQ